jgi:SAM-dependent methyltransferase
MHNGSMLRMRWFASNYIHVPPEGKIKILDVGSGDVNGTYKQLFSNPIFDYTGLDVVSGSNVDITLPNPYDWSGIPTETYDVVICGQVFEHAEFFWLTMVEMARVLRQGGLLCLVVPCTYGFHRHPVDCYRFNADSMVGLARYVGLTILHVDTNCAPANDVTEKPYLKWWYGIRHIDTMLVAHKSYYGPTILPNLTTYECIPMDLNVLRTGLVPYFSYIQSKKFYKIKQWLRNIFERDPY